MTKSNDRELTTVVGRQRVDALVVVRESDVSDRLLMLGLVHRTLAACKHLPGVQRAHEIGLGPLDDPEAHGATHKRTRRHRISLFSIDGTMFLYAMGSGAADNALSDQNDYVDFLIEVIRACRPRTIYLSHITRLMRSTALAERIKLVLKEYGIKLSVEGTTIDVRESSGEFMYQFFGNFSQVERDTIVTRTTAGRIALAQRGGLLFKPKDLPIGYRLQGKRVVPDPSQRTAVEALLRVLARDDLTSREKCEALSVAGVRLPRNYGIAEGDDIGDARDPKSVVRALWKWIDLYETGVYTVYLENKFPGAKRIGTADVIREHEDDLGRVAVRHEWGLPEGGWCSPEVFAAARAGELAARTRAKRFGSGGQGHSQRKPLLGLSTWVDDDGQEWVLDSQKRTEYRLRRRHADKAGPRGGWAEPSIDGVIVARVASAELHASIADTAARAISTGVAMELLQGTGIGVVAGRLISANKPAEVDAALKDEIARLERRARRARERALSLEDPDDSEPWFKEAVTLGRKAKGLKARLGREAQSLPSDTEITDETLDADLCLRALAYLRRTADNAPRAACEALKMLVRDLRFSAPENDRVRWRMSLALPTATGAVLVGPIEGEVPTVTQFYAATKSKLTTGPRTRQALEVLAAGGNLPEVHATVREWSMVQCGTRVRAGLTELGLPAFSLNPLIHCPLPEVRAVVVSALLAKPKPSASDLPELAKQVTPKGCDPKWAELVLRTYLTPAQANHPRVWARSCKTEQGVLDLLVANGGPMRIADIGHAQHQRWTRVELAARLLKDRVEASHTLRPCAQTSWTLQQGQRLSPDTPIEVVDCPHCLGSATRIVRAPEVTRQLLCPDCRRMPQPDSPQFPESYLVVSPDISRRLPWDPTLPSMAQQERDASLSPAQRKARERTCIDCQASYVPRSVTQKRCSTCRLKERRRG